MSSSTGSSFLYVTYIRTTPQKLWDALTQPEFNRKFWFDYWQDCAWQKGAAWKLTSADGRVADSGEVLEIDPPRRLVLRWRNELRPEAKAEGWSRCTFTMETSGDTVKLSVAHEIDVPESKFIMGVSDGWPKILSNLKTLLETGSAPNIMYVRHDQQ